MRPTTETATRFAARWNPLRAWRLRARYTPVARAVGALVGRADAGDAPRRILCVGGSPGALDAILTHPSFAIGPLEVRWVAAAEAPPLAVDGQAFDCAVAIDWLPLVAPSRRQQAVAELCRAARLGVVIAGPFDGREVAAAERAVNDLYRAATGADHPELGRHLEFGLPDLDATREWVAAAFPHVDARPVEQLGLWQAAASLEAFESNGAADDAADVAGAAAFPPLELVSEAEPAYRTVVVASARPVAFDPEHPAALPPERAEITALQMHLALEAAAQRSAFDRLTEAVTSDREREREEFRESVASLAAELHEREAQLEQLGRAIAEYERRTANQSATIAALERRLEETDAHVENLETQLDVTRGHIENLVAERDREHEALLAARSERDREHQAMLAIAAEREREREALVAVRAERDAMLAVTAERDAIRARVSDLERELGDTHQHARNLEEFVDRLGSDAAGAQAMLAESEATHRRLVESRGGRALMAYVRMKQKILGK